MSANPNSLEGDSRMKTLHLNRRDVPPSILNATDYSGRKFRVTVSQRVHIGSQQWSGGTRSTYCAVNLENFLSSI